MPLPDRARWNRLSPLLDELLDLDPEAAQARLNALRATDADLVDELQRLLMSGSATTAVGFLSGVAQPLPPAPPAAERPGARVGPCTLVEALGEGGTGTVWRARRHDGPVESQVAIKLLHLTLLGQTAAQRFAREGQFLGRLNHPNIAALLDAGVTDEGQPYLLVELVDGEPIDAHCRRLALDVDARLRLFLDVLSAVTHAHQRLLVHRDLKPANVMVTPLGQVKLLDFGIAKLLDQEAGGAQATVLTRQAGRALTPTHAAPEQFEGGAISTATDVYALGVMLYELLCGQHPTLPPGATRAELIQAALGTEPPRMSQAVANAANAANAPNAPSAPNAPPAADAANAAARARERSTTPQALARRLAGDLDLIVERMLRKRASERYPTVDAVATDLRRHLANEPISVRPDHWAYRARKFTQRHRGSVLAAGLLGLALTVGLTSTLYQAHRARQQAAFAQAERDRALREAQRAESARDFVQFILSEGLSGAEATQGVLQRARQMIQREFSTDPELRAQLQLLVADVYFQAGNPALAAVMMAEARGSAQASGNERLCEALRCRQTLAQDEVLSPTLIDAARAALASTGPTQAPMRAASR